MRHPCGRALIFVALGLFFAGCQSKRPPDILLVSIDTLRADRLPMYGGRPAAAPFLDSLARKGVVFERVEVPLPATDASHATMLTGLHPLSHGVLLLAVRLPTGFETLAEALARRGYDTSGVVSVFHLGRAYGFDRGFERFADPSSMSPQTSPERVDASLVNRAALEAIDAHRQSAPDRPFFLFVHYFDVHAPYAHRNPLFVPAGASSVPGMPDLYDSGVRYVDDHLRDLFGMLGSRGMTRNLIVCVTGDHGEQLGEHGYSAGHADFYTETTRVPLILSGPGVPVERIGTAISSIGLAPTLLSLAGTRFRNPTDRPDLMSLIRRGDSSRNRPEDQLVIGHLPYTRSFRLERWPWTYVRNLDHIYRYASLEASEPEISDGFVTVRGIAAEGGASRYTVPRLTEDVAAVRARVTAVPGCRVQANVALAPDLMMFREPVDLQDRWFEFAAGTRDAAALWLKPASCISAVGIAVLPYAGSRIALPRWGRDTVLTTDLFLQELLTARKFKAGDEMYDLRTDPGMLRNRISSAPAEAEAFRRRSEELLHRGLLARPFGAAPRYSSDEERKLRSLGYLSGS